MKTVQQWTHIVTDAGDHASLEGLIAEVQRDAIEAAAKVPESYAARWDEAAKEIGMPTPTACGPLEDIADEIRMLIPPATATGKDGEK